MENVTKSIVYGSPYQNRYGRFLPVCSSISDRGTQILNKLPFNPYSTTYIKLLTSKNTIALHMPTE